MFKIRYVNAILDGSGYASCGRSYVKSLIDSGDSITIKQVSFEEARPDIGEYSEYIYPNINKELDFDINIVHLTPEHFLSNYVPGKVNIGLTVWETTKIPKFWVQCCNTMDGIIVPCEWNKQVFEESGVRVPIKVVPHVVDIPNLDGIKEFRPADVPEDAYIFYNISQLTERKGIFETLKAYWHAFSKDDKVAFVLKVYRSNYSEEEVKAVVDIIKRIKHSMPMPPEIGHAPVYLITEMLSYDEIMGLHKACDCFVSLNKAEGFGLPEAEAAVVGNPIITTGFGGVKQFLNEENSLLTNYTLSPVSGMPHIQWYSVDQLCAHADIKHGSDLMCKIFKDKELHKELSAKVKATVKPMLSSKAIGDRFNEVLKFFTDRG